MPALDFIITNTGALVLVKTLSICAFRASIWIANTAAGLGVREIVSRAGLEVAGAIAVGVVPMERWTTG